MRFFTLIFVGLMITQPIWAQSNTENSDANNTRYISDDLFIYMHAGPSREFRIIGSVTAGTKVDMLQIDEEAGYVEIIDERSRQGWVPVKFVSRTPSIRYVLEDSQRKLAQAQQKTEDLQGEIEALNTNFAESKQQKVLLNRQVTKQLEEIAELKRRISQKSKLDQMEWFTRGTILALISVLVGYILGRFARPKNKDRLM